MLSGAQVEGHWSQAPWDVGLADCDRQAAAAAGDDPRQIQAEAVGAGAADLDGAQRLQTPVVVPATAH